MPSTSSSTTSPCAEPAVELEARSARGGARAEHLARDSSVWLREA